MSDTRRTHEPDSELGQLADAMLNVAHNGGGDGVRAIVMLHDGDEGMIAFGGYEGNEDNDVDAITDLFLYLKKVMEANGKQMIVMPMVGPSLS